MKKLFVSILALAAFAACQSDFNDVTTNTPGVSDDVVPEGMVRIYAEVGIGEEGTKATYDDNLNAKWEEGDQIALLQESANYNAPFSTVNKLNIKSGAGTSYAAFNGDIIVPTESPRIYHIAYPASAVSFSTTMSQEVTVESDNYHESTWQMGQYSATGYATCTYNSTLSITVPTTQKGKWEPYMYALTEEAVSSNGIGAKTLNTLTGAIAIRAFEADGVTPKQLKQITITSSDAAIAGTFSGTAQSVGRTPSVTGPKSDGNKSNVLQKDEMISDARGKLTTALQGYTATSTTVTKAMSLSFAGSDQKKVTAENLETIAKDADGYYTYHLNVAPFEGQGLTIELMDAKGLAMKCNVSAKSLSAGHRLGYEIKWVYEDASLTGEYIKTWYNNPTDSFEFADNTIHVGKLEIVGNIEPENVIEMGVMVNDTLYEKVEKTLSHPAFDIELSSGDYNVYAYAKVNLNGKETILKAYEGTYKVTSIPTLTNYSVWSSYSKDGTDAKNNSIDGHLLKVTASLSDSYFVDNGLATIEVYNGNDKLGNITNGEWSNPNAALGQYDCYVKIKFTNNYEIKTKEYTTHVTGIPYSIAFDSANPANWSCSNQAYQDNAFILKTKEAYAISPMFHIPANLTLSVSIPLYCYTPNNWTKKFNETFYVSASSGGDVKNNVFYTEYVTNNGYGSSKFSNKSGQVTLTSSQPYICLHATGDNNSSVAGKNSGIFLQSITVNY